MTERDWAHIVRAETCPECGLCASGIAPGRLGAAIVNEAERWCEQLATCGVGEGVRRRPAPGVWSPLEYACHVRDTLALFAHRVDRVLAEDGPELGWWDHEAAVTEQWYNAEEPDDVAAAIRANAALVSATLGTDRPDEEWERWGTRRGYERLTVTDLGRFALHETRHHRLDAGGERG